MTRHKCKRNDQQTGDHTKFYHPFISYRVPERTDEKNGQYKVGKSQPVKSVKQERILNGRFINAFMQSFDPGLNKTDVPGHSVQKINFRFYGYSRQSADE